MPTDEQLQTMSRVRTVQRSWADDPNDPGAYESVILVTVAYRPETVRGALAAEPLASGLLPADAVRDLGQPVVDALRAARRGPRGGE